MAISEGNVKDLIASFLIQMSVIHDGEHVSNIKLGELKDGQYPLTVTFGAEVQKLSFG